jgi:hypothetical protein
MTIAGTEMQCIEIYTGESYTLPFTFTYANTVPIDCSGWSLSTDAKFYNIDTVTYPTLDEVILGNLSLLDPQPTSSGYSTLDAAFTNAALGQGYIYVPDTLTGGFGSPDPTPIIDLANSGANSTLVIITMGVSRTDVLSGLINYNKEPFGIIVRYQ